MRSLAILLVSASAAFAGSFYTGQAARLVIGQPTFTAQNPASGASIVGGVSGLAYANGMLFVADSNRVFASPINNRVLVFKNLLSQVPDPKAELPQGVRCPACVGVADLVLGQPDFEERELGLERGMRLPTAVATDGVRLAVADTDNNRILIWNSIPTVNQQQADLVLGQANFTSNIISGSGDPRVPTASSLRGPQGVWFYGGKFFVADTQNHRILIWNSIPTQNGQPADVVLGQPNFGTFIQPDLTQTPILPAANNMLNPISVSAIRGADGVERLFVTDLGHNRILIWNSIPATNQQSADVVVGQPDFQTAAGNNSRALCDPVGTDDATDEPIYPRRCEATLDWPRFAISDGRRLFAADGGNDRVLIWNQIPAQNGAKADVTLGQLTPFRVDSEAADPLRRAATDNLRTPMSLAWDGANLYVSDPFNRRIMVFSEADEAPIPFTGVRNAASREVVAVGAITVEGTAAANIDLTVRVGDREYTYRTVEGGTLDSVIFGLVEAINANGGDPDVFATPNPVYGAIVLTAREGGEAGNFVEYSATTTDARITLTASGGRLQGGQDAAQIAEGTLVSILGEDLANFTASANLEAEELPRELEGLRVYIDGIAAPLLFVSPRQINAQLPFEVRGASSVSVYIRRLENGHPVVTAPRAVTVIRQNPGIFAFEGEDPRPGIALHSSSFATGSILLTGTAEAGNVATVTINDRPYSYTAVADDTLDRVRDELIQRINESDPEVQAFPGGQFSWIRLRALAPGPAGNDIRYGGSVSDGSDITLSATSDVLCCANEAGALVTPDNPAVPGETIIIYATGLGAVDPEEARTAARTGEAYQGPELNRAIEFVSSLAGGRTANVLFAGLKQGSVGMYEIHLQLNPGLPTNPATQIWIAQDLFISNVVTIPVFNANPEAQ